MNRPASTRSKAVVISCDIVGHSRSSQDEQHRRVRKINELVRTVLDQLPTGGVVWASGGDGGHVLFLADEWHQHAIDLVRRLHLLTMDDHVPLRITGHYGIIETIPGADGRTQPVGEAINTAGWILERASPAGIIVSDSFRHRFQDLHGTTLEFHSARTIAMSEEHHIDLCLMTLSGLGPPSAWTDPARVTVTNLDARIGVIRSEGNQRMADALEAIARSVATAPELSPDQRLALTENVEDLAEQALTVPDQRRRGRVKAALQAVKETAGVASSVADWVKDWGDVLADLV